MPTPAEIMAAHLELKEIEEILFKGLIGVMLKMLELLFLIGTILAVVSSYEKYHSVKWSVLAGLAGWLYMWFPSLFEV